MPDTYAIRLFEALRNFFPKLDFTLLIINQSFEPLYKRELSNNILMIQGRTHPYLDIGGLESYKNFLQSLINKNPLFTK